MGGFWGRLSRVSLACWNPEAVRPGWISINTTTSTCQTQGASTDSHLGVALAVRRPQPAPHTHQSHQPRHSSILPAAVFYPTVNTENTSEQLNHPGSHPLRTPDELLAGRGHALLTFNRLI